MTISRVVAVSDRAMGAFGRPLFVPSIGVALRSFADEVNRKAPDNQMSVHPEDFELWYLGEFDETTGNFSCADPEGKRLLVRGKEVVNKE